MNESSAPPLAALRNISLALQGGGSHGAFTWGVLDALLADARLEFDGISGASAGAVNAVALAHGYARARQEQLEPRQAARDALARLWHEIIALGSLGAMRKNLLRLFTGGFPAQHAPASSIAGTVSQWVSPYQTNPLDINPLRSLLEREINFEALAGLAAPKVFVSATHVSTGKAEIFHGKRLSAQAVMASACLPMLFQAMEIDGQHFWDGGYSANPALAPLISLCDSRDIVLVQLNPLRREQVPQTAGEILDRANELTFNASLLSQLRAIDFIHRLLADGRLQESRTYKRLLLHRIDGGQALEEYPASSRLSPDGELVEKLFALGQQAAQDWLKRHFESIGRQSTVDIRRDYGEDMPPGF